MHHIPNQERRLFVAQMQNGSPNNRKAQSDGQQGFTVCLVRFDGSSLPRAPFMGQNAQFQ